MCIGEKKGKGPFDAAIVLIKEYFKAASALEFHSSAGHSNLFIDGLLLVCILLTMLAGGLSESVKAICAAFRPEICQYVFDYSFVILIGILGGMIIICLIFMAVCEYVCRNSIPKQ